MDAQALTFFVDIVDAGNLSQAARQLKMSRANVSYHLAQMERSLGLQLMRRTTRQVELTEAGQHLYCHGRVIRDEVQAAREAVARLGQGLHGSLRVSVPTGFGQMVMADWLIAFKRLYPDIALDLRFDNRVDDLLREEIDLAVRVMSEPPQATVAIELARVRHIVCATPDWDARQGLPQQLEQLAGLPLLTSAVVGRELRVAAYRDTERREIALQPTLASENFPFLREAVLAGLGVGLLPDYMVRQDLAEGRLLTSLQDWRLSVFGTRLYLLRMPDRYQTLAMRTLIDFIVARARDWARSVTPEEATAP